VKNVPERYTDGQTDGQTERERDRQTDDLLWHNQVAFNKNK